MTEDAVSHDICPDTGEPCTCDGSKPCTCGCGGCGHTAEEEAAAAAYREAHREGPSSDALDRDAKSSFRSIHHKGACPQCGGLEHVDETGLKHGFCAPDTQKRFYLHRNQNETSARRLMRNFAATVRYYPYSIKLAAHEAPRTTLFFSINWRKHELHAESSRRAQGPLSRAA